MRSLLYLSPYFPPDARVGALRPLKFARHLPRFGYRPVVLSDVPSGRPDPRLAATLPGEVVVVRDFAWSTRHRSARVARIDARAPSKAPRPWRRFAAPLEEFLSTPELVPLGPYAVHIPHALVAARRLLERHRCQAILVNADPFAATLVGALLARETGVPLLVDLRDPWALCSLRRPLRRPWVATCVDALERFVVSTATKVILNTQTAREDYVAHYGDLDAQRFVAVPNHADPTLGRPSVPRWRPPRCRLLFAGTLRRFVEGGLLLDLLAVLKARGFDGAALELAITGELPAPFLRRAAELGVEAMLERLPAVSYLDVPSLLESADLLLVLSHRDRQRIPAKIYDYAATRRPIAVVTENPELIELARRIGGARSFGYGELSPLANFVTTLARDPEARDVSRHFAWNSIEATRRLAAALDAAVGAASASGSDLAALA